MRTLKYLRSAFVILFCAIALTTSNICSNIVTAEPVATIQKEIVEENQNTSALTIIASPEKFLNKEITINAKFDKFSTLGLDYKPAFKSSEEYISFLIKREDSSFDIPLSEMKLFIKRTEAEKFIDLKSNDEVQITGTVFSDALGDTWIDVTKLTLIKKTAENKTE